VVKRGIDDGQDKGIFLARTHGVRMKDINEGHEGDSIYKDPDI
jgi:hypothetical protein